MRSASLTMMTRISSTMASSILRKLSAWRSSAEKKSSLVSLVTPSTQRATSSPNSLRTCSTVTLVSSTTSCSRPVSHGHHVHAHVGQDVGHHERVHHVGLAGIARLSLVVLAGEAKGLLEAGQIVLGTVLADLQFQLAVQLLDGILGRQRERYTGVAGGIGGHV